MTFQPGDQPGSDEKFRTCSTDIYVSHNKRHANVRNIETGMPHFAIGARFISQLQMIHPAIPSPGVSLRTPPYSSLPDE